MATAGRCAVRPHHSIFYVQRELEVAAEADDPAIVLCDRGTVDCHNVKLIGETNTLTLHVERAYAEYESVPAFAAASLLTTVGLLTVALDLLWRRRKTR